MPELPDSRQLVWHDLKFKEENEFQVPPEEGFKRHPMNERFGMRCAFIDEQETTASLTYRWQSGAPERMYTDKSGLYVPVEKKLTIETGQWASIQYNGRFSGMDSGIWWYEQETVNVAVVEEFKPTLFLDSPAVESYQQLAKLW